MKTLDLTDGEVAFLRACIYTAVDEGGPYGKGAVSLTVIEELELYRKLGIDEASPFMMNLKEGKLR